MDPKIFHAFDLPTPTEVRQLAGGANNRVFRLDFSDRPSLVYKEYFQHPNDQRPRLQAEYSFLTYAWNLGLRNIPQPLKCDPALNSALYSHLPGSHIKKEDINASHIQQKADFFLALNHDKSSAAQLPYASESCFTLDAFLQITEGRIERISKAPSDSLLYPSLRAMIDRQILPKWSRIHEVVCKADLHLTLSQEERCISPSDFGFHNALLGPDHALRFIDFEYAGWDDPCKTICDLFCQPRIPIPEHYFPILSNAIARAAAHPERCLERVRLIWPVMQMKWCCILLNSFTQVGKNRRQFSQSEELAHQEKQLQMAQELLNKIEEPHGIHRFHLASP